jgi:hypothetical protein
MELGHDEDRGRTMSPGAVAAGGILLALGLAMLLDTTGTLSLQPGRLIGPFVLIALGTSIVLNRRACGRASSDDPIVREGRRGRRARGSTGGLWLIGLGTWMLVAQTHLFGLSYETAWPLLLVFMGLVIAIRGLR